ncbi:dimethylamine monooxygenase subunit DmmA family protein [Novosphingobium sp.]|uniref:dimethylamine monooxygenase subunit DmmA family protein n=1 Tax=Novosphingobium sp. TaxID=1874826 RepID=UPI00333FEF83
MNAVTQAQSGTSRPRYSPLAPVPAARAHLLVTDGAVIDPVALAVGVSPTDFVETWCVVAHAKVLPQPFGGPGVQQFRSASHLIALLAHRLAAETMGLRLYAVGSEPFVWDVARAAGAAGMGREELRLFATGATTRRVSCVHCRTVNPGVTTTLVQCAGCGALLEVRDHFSRVHNTWLGVQCDAEIPGAIPPTEPLDQDVGA